jgi:hypothetical protein
MPAPTPTADDPTTITTIEELQQTPPNDGGDEG